MSGDKKRMIRGIAAMLLMAYLIGGLGLYASYENKYKAHFFEDTKLREYAFYETVENNYLNVSTISSFIEAQASLTEEAFGLFTSPIVEHNKAVLSVEYIKFDGMKKSESFYNGDRKIVVELDENSLGQLVIDENRSYLLFKQFVDGDDVLATYSVITPIGFDLEKKTYEGLAVVVYSYGEFFAEATKYFEKSNIQTYISRKNEMGIYEVIYSNSGLDLNVADLQSLKLYYAFEVSIAEETWRIFEVPTTEYRNQVRSKNDLQLFVISIFMVFVIYAYIRKSIKDKKLLQMTVIERTNALSNSEKKLQMALDGAELGLWQWDMVTDTLEVNERFIEMTGYTEGLTCGKLSNSLDRIAIKDKDEVRDKLQKLLNGEIDSFRSEHRIMKDDLTEIWVVNKVRVHEWDSEGQPVKASGTYLDVTEIISLKKKYQSLATKDQLTGLYNRRHYFEEIQKNLYRYNRLQEPFTIAIIDLDYFKVINDTYGHPAGDYILETFAKVLHNQIRNNDILARYGGEEFVFLLENTNKHQALAILERMKEEAIDFEYVYQGIEIEFTFSGGIADVTESNEIEELIRLADERLYTAKADGRNRLINT